MNLEIKIKQGIGDIKFDMPVEEVVSLLGNASEVENIDNAADESTTVLRYEEEGLTLFFEGENPTLSCIDISNEDSTLFGEDVFDLEEDELIDLLKKNNYSDIDTDTEDWGEKRISIAAGNVDFYFDEGYLMSVILGK